MLNKKEAVTNKRHADEISPQYTSETGSGNTASINDTVSSNNHEVKHSVATKHKIANAFDDTPTLLYFINPPQLWMSRIGGVPIKTVLFLKPIYFKNIFIMVPPTITKAKATKIYRKITMTINFTIRYML